MKRRTKKIQIFFHEWNFLKTKKNFSMIKKNLQSIKKKNSSTNKKKFLMNQKKFFDMQNHYRNELWVILLNDDAVSENNSYFTKSMNAQLIKKPVMIDEKKAYHVNSEEIKIWRKRDDNIYWKNNSVFVHLINAENSKFIAKIKIKSKRFFKKKWVQFKHSSKNIKQVSEQNLRFKKRSVIQKKIVKFQKNLHNKTKKTNSINDSILMTNEKVWDNLNVEHIKKKNMSKHSETTDSYHNLLNDAKSHTIEKIQKMKNVENDQRRKKFKLSISQIAKKIDENYFLKKRYFNRKFFQLDKNFVNYKMNQQRILNKNFYFSFFYETLFFKKKKSVSQITKIFIFYHFTINFFSIFSKNFFYIKFSKHSQNFYWNRKKSETSRTIKSLICEILFRRRTRSLTL